MKKYIIIYDTDGVNANVQLMGGALDHYCVRLIFCGIIIDVPS